MKKKQNWIIAAGILILLAIVLVILFWCTNFHRKTDSIVESFAPKETSQSTGNLAYDETKDEISDTETVSDYQSPVDFESLWKVNTDIKGWLEIPETEITYPVLRHDTENTFYLNHDSEGEYSAYGSIFMENYNAEDFSDRATVLYGHYSAAGDYFGSLESTYSDAGKFEQYQYIKIYLPDKTLTYKIFAALPHSNEHLLYYHDFSDDAAYDDFIKDITQTKTLGAVIDETAIPQDRENLLILSTCKKSDRTQRFLVIGALESVSR